MIRAFFDYSIIWNRDKLGLSWAKLSLAGVRISLVFIGLGYGEKYFGL